MARMRFPRRKTECVILTAISRQEWLYERVAVFGHTYIACFVRNYPCPLNSEGGRRWRKLNTVLTKHVVLAWNS